MFFQKSYNALGQGCPTRGPRGCFKWPAMS